MKNRKNRKAFTLIELLVVIAIIAVLSVVVILSLNPAELLRQSRDSNRISDMATLKSAISLYLADQSTPNLASTTAGVAAGCPGATSYGCSYYSNLLTSTVVSDLSSGFNTFAYGTTTAFGASQRNINSTGWIPVNFAAISSGAPIGSLPVDPVNVGSSTDAYGNPLVYGYAATSTGTTFKITVHMESAKFRSGGGADVETTDGGTSSDTYEQGTNLNL
jgi:prepilin-type N-terminal cleavage/methylation domain-containing protein